MKSCAPLVRARGAILMLALLLGVEVWAQSASEHYEQALVAYNLGEVRTAFIHTKNALDEDPLLLSAHLLLAKIHLAIGNGAEAEKEISIANRLGAHRSLILVPLAKAYLQQGKNEQLLSELFPIGTAPEEDSELLTLRGQAHLELGQIYEAERAFDQAWQRAPNSVAAVLGRAQTRFQRGELTDALEEAKRAAKLSPQDPRVWYLKAIIERDLGNSEAALGDFKRAVEVEPGHLPAQIGRVGLLIDLKRVEDATEIIAKIHDSYPLDPRAPFLEAVIYAQKGDAQASNRSLEESATLLSQLPKELVEGHSPTMLLAGMINFNLKKWEQASNYLDLYIKRHPQEVGPRKLLAQILLGRRQYQAVISLLEPGLETTPSDPGLLTLLAEAYARDGQHLKASQLFEQAVQANTEDLRVRTQQAINDFFLGRRSQAIDRLSAIFSASPDLDSAGSTLVVMLMQKRQFERAAAIADEVVSRHPDNLTYINLQGVAHFAIGDWETARQSFLQALDIDPSFLPARINLAKNDLREGKAPEAQIRLEALLDEHPFHLGAMLELARAFEVQGNVKDAQGWAERAINTDPDAHQAAVYLTDLLLRTKQPDKALQVAEQIEVRQPDNMHVLEALSRAYLANGQGPTAQVVLQRTATLAGYDAHQLMEIAMLQREAGDMDGAVWSLQKAVEGEPDYLPARIRLGEFLASLGRIEKAELVAKELKRDYPDEPYGYHLTGTIEQGTGDYEGALASYRAALERKKSGILAVRAYEAQRRVEGNEAATAFLQEWLVEHPGEAVVRQTLADGYFEEERWEQAKVLFEESLAEAPNNPLLLNNLALIYVQTDDPRALEYAQKAYDLLPGVPDVSDTLGWILVRSGRDSEGLKYLRDAQFRAADDPGISYHIAVALNDLGRPQEALIELQKALRAQDDFTGRTEAEAMLELLQKGADG